MLARFDEVLAVKLLAPYQLASDAFTDLRELLRRAAKLRALAARGQLTRSGGLGELA